VSGPFTTPSQRNGVPKEEVERLTKSMLEGPTAHPTEESEPPSAARVRTRAEKKTTLVPKLVRVSVFIDEKQHHNLRIRAAEQDLPIRDFLLSLIEPHLA
jgi:hypothetical protein